MADGDGDGRAAGGNEDTRGNGCRSNEGQLFVCFLFVFCLFFDCFYFLYMFFFASFAFSLLLFHFWMIFNFSSSLYLQQIATIVSQLGVPECVFEEDFIDAFGNKMKSHGN